jgi:ribosomal protein S18 acetylase RimI-like enzyme
MDMTVREYRDADDLQAVRMCLIELQDFERTLDPRLPAGATIADAYLEGLFRRCDQFAGKLFVAEAHGSVVGFVSVLGNCRSEAPDDDAELFAYVDDLVVLPPYRGQGYGRSLLGRAEAYAAAQGRSTLRLRVKGGNHSARKFYDRAGYGEYEVELEKQVGVRRTKTTQDI